MDSSREIRSMILSAFPCPPLEMDNGKNSHDLLAYLIDLTARRNIRSDKRKSDQEILTLDFIDDFPKCKTEQELENCMTRFTRDYMLLYFPVMHEIRFNPIDSIKLPIKKQLCSWIAAQYIMNQEECDGSDFLHMSSLELYRLASQLIKTANLVSCKEPISRTENGNSRSLE